jgi:phage tail-like protein
MPVRRDDPYAGFNFVVEIAGAPIAGFSEAQLPAGTIEVIRYREGADRRSGDRLLPGRVAYANVILRRGFAGATDLYDWWDAIRNGAIDRRDIAITLLDEARDAVGRWLLDRAWPTRLAYGHLDALGNELAIESLELVYERFALD